MTLAAASVSAAVLDLHELPLLGLGTEEIQVSDGSSLVGSTLADVLQDHPAAYVIGLRRDDQLHPWHTIDGSLRSGDVLVVLGAPEYLVALASAASPESRLIDSP